MPLEERNGSRSAKEAKKKGAGRKTYRDAAASSSVLYSASSREGVFSETHELSEAK